MLVLHVIHMDRILKLADCKLPCQHMDLLFSGSKILTTESQSSEDAWCMKAVRRQNVSKIFSFNVSFCNSSPQALSLLAPSVQQPFTHLVRSSGVNGGHESPATSRHFHISVLWLNVRRVCLGTLSGHCGQWVTGSTDSHCVQRMHPSF